MPLLDRRRRRAADTEAVAAHLRRAELALLVAEGAVHLLGVRGAQLEDVADLDAPRDAEYAGAAARAGVGGLGGHHVDPFERTRARHVPVPAHGDEVLVAGVGAADEAGERTRRLVDHQAHLGRKADRTREAERTARRRRHLLGRSEPQPEAAQHVQQLDFVHLAVAADRNRRQAVVRLVDQRLDHEGPVDLEHPGDLGHRRRSRGRNPAGLAVAAATALLRGRQSADLRPLDVGAVAAGRAARHRALAGVREHHELVRRGTADRALVRLDHGVLEPAGLEDARVGRVHGLVAPVEPLLRGVEGVGVLHDELPAAHEPEPGTDLVPELGLDLEQVERHLPVALHVAADEVGDDLLVGRTETEPPAVTVLHPQQLGAVLEPALRLLPELGGLDRRHRELDRARPLHLAADDRHQLARGPPAGRLHRVDPRGEPPHESGARHQLVADHLGVPGRLAGGYQVVVAPAHRRSPAAEITNK